MIWHTRSESTGKEDRVLILVELSRSERDVGWRSAVGHRRFLKIDGNIKLTGADYPKRLAISIAAERPPASNHHVAGQVSRSLEKGGEMA